MDPRPKVDVDPSKIALPVKKLFPNVEKVEMTVVANLYVGIDSLASNIRDLKIKSKEIRKEIGRISKLIREERRISEYFHYWNGGRIPSKVGKLIFKTWKRYINDKEFTYSDITKFFVRYTEEDIEKIKIGKICEADAHGDTFMFREMVLQWFKKDWVEKSIVTRTCNSSRLSAEYEFFKVK